MVHNLFFTAKFSIDYKKRISYTLRSLYGKYILVDTIWCQGLSIAIFLTILHRIKGHTDSRVKCRACHGKHSVRTTDDF